MKLAEFGQLTTVERHVQAFSEGLVTAVMGGIMATAGALV